MTDPQVAECIRIADKHLAGESAERRCELAKEILTAIMAHAERVALETIKEVVEKQRGLQ